MTASAGAGEFTEFRDRNLAGRAAPRGGPTHFLAAVCGVVALLTTPQSPLRAQQAATGGGPKIAEIRVKGNRRFTEEQVVAASGLQAGNAASQQILDAAASRLAKTGAFTDVSYQYRARGASWEAEFQVTEAPRFLPCIYDNFLWFSDAELTAAARHDVPLFDGSLPEGRGMQDEVAAALVQFLRAHQIPGSTVVRPMLDPKGKLGGFILRVIGVPMPVLSVEVDGGPLDAAVISQVTHGIVEHDYSRSASRYLAATSLLETYQNEGYLQPRFSEPIPVLHDVAGKDTSQGVTVKFMVTPGPRYSWAGVTWSGNQALGSAELTKLLALSAGEIARRDRTLAGWDAVHEAFGHLGYITAEVKATPNYDDQAATVRFDVQINEGPQFVMGELRVDDPSPKVAEQLAAAWPLQRGQIYDLAAEKDFLRTGAWQALAHATVTRKSLGAERETHRDTRTVNVLLRTSQ